jgi:AbrB family looped-hinge helix DNA binding protein
MTRIIATITQAGRVTLPPEVRRILKVKPGDRVTFEIEGSRVSMVPAEFTIRSVAGSVGPPTTSEEIEQRIRAAKEEMAAAVVEKMRVE